MFKELKASIPKEVKEGIKAVFHQVDDPMIWVFDSSKTHDKI
jgi:hypothetical protein